MQLKKYQQKVLDALEKYVLEIKKYDTAKAAGVAFMVQADKQYNWVPELGSSPFVCVKVPTGGGKTIIASSALGVLFKQFVPERNDHGLVMWFVPSDAIKKQTLDNLRNRKHPYRSILDDRFDTAVKVFDLSEAKTMKKDDLRDNACIVVTTLSAFRRTDREWLKVFQDNGSLMTHFENEEIDKLDFLQKNKQGGVVFSLANVIKLYNPLVIVDEGHNVQTNLSFDMLKELNPAFILEFTATPKGQSNVLINISAQELKEEKMIKMPIYLANQTPWQDTVYAGIEKIKELEKITQKLKGEYIRPIMLIQAEQELVNEKKIYVDKIVKFLLEEAKIPAEQIAIQTSKTKQLPTAEELADKKCPIRYIITVNALREGWDCPFAYVLVSVSNMGARLSVEQTIGRLMRLPGAKEKADPALNSAYVFACTRNFSETSEMVIKALQENGYEDVVGVANGVNIVRNVFARKIKDKNIILPLLNIKEGEKYRKMDYVGDLIGDDSILVSASFSGGVKLESDSKMIKIDIGHEGELVRDSVGKLGLIYHHQDLSRAELESWFITKIQRGFISIKEMSGYVSKAIGVLLSKYSLSALSTNRYQVKEEIDRQIDLAVDKHTKKKFIELKKLLKSEGEGLVLGAEISLLQYTKDNFIKHLYERAGAMNREELDLAFKIDNSDNVLWWFRNPDVGGFYIQGWLKHKFYPDFVVKTKKGNYFVLEYKGEHLEGSEDSEYKMEIGKIWQELADKNYHFEWVDKKNMVEVVDKISKL